MAAPGRGLVKDDLARVDPGEIADGCKTGAGSLAGGGGTGRSASSSVWGRLRERSLPQQHRMAISGCRTWNRNGDGSGVGLQLKKIRIGAGQQRHSVMNSAQAKGKKSIEPDAPGPRDVGLFTLRQQRVKLVEQAIVGDEPPSSLREGTSPRRGRQKQRHGFRHLWKARPQHTSPGPFLSGGGSALSSPNAFSTSPGTMNLYISEAITSVASSRRSRGTRGGTVPEMLVSCQQRLLDAACTRWHQVQKGISKRLVFRRCVGSRS